VKLFEPMNTTWTVAKLVMLNHVDFTSYNLMKLTYAAVEAKISLLLAFVNLVIHNEKNTVKATMTPSRASGESSYKTTTGVMIKKEAKIVASMEAAPRTAGSLYVTILP
jgi:hypothetical protein